MAIRLATVLAFSVTMIGCGPGYVDPSDFTGCYFRDDAMAFRIYEDRFVSDALNADIESFEEIRGRQTFTAELQLTWDPVSEEVLAGRPYRTRTQVRRLGRLRFVELPDQSVVDQPEKWRTHIFQRGACKEGQS